MSHTVALYGATGNLGVPTLANLLKAHAAGKLRLVIILRPSSKADPEIERVGAELRRIDIDAANEAEIDAAVEGIAYLMCVAADGPSHVDRSTIGVTGYKAQGRLLEALVRSKDFVTMTPALYGRWWRPDELERFPLLKEREDLERQPERRLRELGKGITDVGAGVFGKHLLQYGALGLEIAQNSIRLNEGMRKYQFPITTLDHLAHGLAWVATQPPASIANQRFTFITHWVTGDDLVVGTHQVNGAEPTVIDYPIEEILALEHTGGDGPIVAAFLSSWTEGKERGSYEDANVVDLPFEAPSLVEEIKEAKRRIEAGLD